MINFSFAEFLSKVIFKTKSVLTFNNHRITTCLNRPCKTWFLGITEGESRHYKSWSKTKMKITAANRVNASELFFHDKLEINTNEVFDDLMQSGHLGS